MSAYSGSDIFHPECGDDREFAIRFADGSYAMDPFDRSERAAYTEAEALKLIRDNDWNATVELY